MIKYFCYIFLAFFLFSCSTKKSSEKLIVDAGSFLDNSQKKKIEDLLLGVSKKGQYHLFLYTVIAEKYYKHQNYDEYIFDFVSKNDTANNMNVLLYLSYDDKKIKIHTGNRAKEKLTDSLSQLAINNLKPYLSQRQYYEGFKTAINYIDSIFMKSSNVEK